MTTNLTMINSVFKIDKKETDKKKTKKNKI